MTMACMLGGSVTTTGNTDVCLVPPEVPTPFPNMATWTNSIGFVPEILIIMSPSCNILTSISISTGDEPGKEGGVKSGTTQGVFQPLTGLPNVLLNGLPACNVGITNGTSNTTNTTSIYTIPSQTVVVAA
ncbi:PAAR-like domain-containing protein [Legionella quinlivanii]|nr:PAAR-like domain-containing protein [Legionella quinlivanii]